MTGRKTYNFPHRPRPRQRPQASQPQALPQGGLLATLTLERRASEELDMAQCATKTEVVAVHCRLADAYLERLAALRAASEADTISTMVKVGI